MTMPSIQKKGLRKMAALAIVVNCLQIAFALAMFLYALFSRNFSIPESAEIALIGVVCCIVIWGAVVDIRDALITRQVEAQREMLEDAYRQLEELNRKLRAQRHDFKNHLQVVYSLSEMGAYPDMQEYVQRIYEDVQALGDNIRTGVPALNALLSAKSNDLEGNGIELKVDIYSAWTDIPVPGWEICRIAGNLLDNAADALRSQMPEAPYVHVEICEDLYSWSLNVENNGPAIPLSIRESIFLPGFSTKGENRGNGMGIVRSLLEKYGGSIDFESDTQRTRFTCRVPKPSAGNHMQED